MQRVYINQDQPGSRWALESVQCAEVAQVQ